ncbi:hypothetical protein [Sporosarcina beigongshangi]|uniref:hypothetical protein n=1 Tax=Sporosarcina beigongshangi TaxID=2782538 RepID=UPI0019399032|nr:hypothetical protein [Sporosarcina beigongshangi]
MGKLKSGRDTDKDMDKSGSESTSNTPSWVKMFGLIAIVLIVLVVIIMFFSDGEHGPGRHLNSNGTGIQTPPIEQGMRQL